MCFVSQATHVLEASDHKGRTLLMHAARLGSAPVFRVVLDAMWLANGKSGERVSGRFV